MVGVRRARLGVATGALAALLALPCAAGAQASPYLPLDDTRYPLLELLIARGELEDPSPMLRPFRIADALRVLVTASATTRASRVGEAKGLDDAGAMREVKSEDAARRDYLRRFYRIDDEAPVHYDLVVNTDVLSVEQAARLVVQAASG